MAVCAGRGREREEYFVIRKEKQLSTSSGYAELITLSGGVVLSILRGDC